eukprot:6187508-Pleurochrysis_carterae.AAC.3
MSSLPTLPAISIERSRSITEDTIIHGQRITVQHNSTKQAANRRPCSRKARELISSDARYAELYPVSTRDSDHHEVQENRGALNTVERMKIADKLINTIAEESPRAASRVHRGEFLEERERDDRVGCKLDEGRGKSGPEHEDALRGDGLARAVEHGGVL